MNTLVLNKKKYVVVEQKVYDKLVEKAASKTPSLRKLSLAEGKKAAYAFISLFQKKATLFINWCYENFNIVSDSKASYRF